MAPSSSRTSDARGATQAYLNAYLEMAFAIMALRIPTVRKYLVDGFPAAAISSSYDQQDVILNTNRILADLDRPEADGRAAMRRSFDQINRTFIAAMWESLYSHQTYPKICTEPSVQFFKHVRNACAHDGRFNFTELGHPARWRDKEITMKMSGTAPFPDFLADGDVILMVVDINNQYFHPVEFPGYVE